MEGEGLEDIYEGMSCTVDLVSERVDDVLIIPKRAITTQGDKNYVNVKQEDGTSLQQEVTLGFTDGSSYEVTSGLEEGDIVLIESQINRTTDSESQTSGAGETPEQMGGTPPTGMEGGMPDGASRNS